MKKIGVVGCGLMGSGIAEVCARAGLDVVVAEFNSAGVDAGRARLESSLLRAEQRNKLDSAAEVLDRIRIVQGLERVC
jgi:3-hydroxybutyryl-CoA dehydrogenase